MSESDFLPASSTSAKARKAAKTKSAKRAHSSLLPTQPSASTSKAALANEDAVMDDMGFERLPLDHRTKAEKDKAKKAAKFTAEEANAAMDEDNAGDDDDEDSIMIDPSTLSLPVPVTRTPISSITGADALSFPAVSHQVNAGLTQRRKVAIPPHRMTPLKRDWIKIYGPLVEECGLQVRMNVQRRWVEMKTSKHTPSPSSLTRASDFLGAYALGFSAEDAIALLRLEELYVESFEIKDVKTLHGDHLSRAIGRIAGHEGKTRFVIENASRTRIVLADTKIHILGTFGNIKIARDAICALILGSPPGKVYAGLRIVASRGRERF
ncbi:pre-rRNA-processing protein PNO1 [Pseudohyphozyma bogoriensis]|nr:pre-rRNA-processing protein PNO1 [Pseudohyphozyma bogoriensis]